MLQNPAHVLIPVLSFLEERAGLLSFPPCCPTSSQDPFLEKSPAHHPVPFNPQVQNHQVLAPYTPHPSRALSPEGGSVHPSLLHMGSL